MIDDNEEGGMRKDQKIACRGMRHLTPDAGNVVEALVTGTPHLAPAETGLGALDRGLLVV